MCCPMVFSRYTPGPEIWKMEAKWLRGDGPPGAAPHAALFEGTQQPGTFKTQLFDYSSTISKPSRFRSQENFEPREEKTKPAATQKTAPPEFEGFYLQQATKEFAEDLDKIRAADDFKNDAVPMLVHALKQGATMFSPAEQARIVEGTSGR
ncbi:hypothetical protein MCOR29_011481 [Pyricularia oryzae]|nr:hypothetical protein MCOR29_011481 [Pyricularia oryzae]KAI6330954.1 hypothetical protein MCOR28_011506 [Pyricularia oryzae]KAI6446333.1 hypothetical protein MCOR22_003845 [Pyricularia oryzae]